MPGGTLYLQRATSTGIWLVGGREGLKEVIAMLRTAFPDIRWVTDETISAGEKVVTRFTWTGTHRGPFLGIPPTSKPRPRQGYRH